MVYALNGDTNVFTTYIKTPLEVRQAHIDENTPCVERGGNSTNHKGVLAQFLNTDIPERGVDLCHYCGNGKCSNPKHLYWGTRSENMKDYIRHGGKSIWDLQVEKYGYAGACAVNKKRSMGNKNAVGNRGKPKSQAHRDKISANHRGGRKKNENASVC